MNVFRKYLVRKPLYFAAVTVLLVAAIAFSSLGFSAWYAAGKQLDEADSGYTSIAVPYNEEFPGFMPSVSEYPMRTTFDLDRLLEDAPVEASIDRRVVLGAYIEGTASLTTEVFGYVEGYLNLNYDVELDEPYNMSVLAVRCEEVTTEAFESYGEQYDSEGNLLSAETKTRFLHRAVFTVEDVLCRLGRRFDYSDQIEITTDVGNAEGMSPFEAGKTYIVRGRSYESGFFALDNGAADGGLAEVSSNGLVYSVPEEGILPLYAEYTGDLWEYLEGEGRIWLDEVIPAVELNYSAAKLMLTDNVYSMYWFNTGDASILEGRPFTREEYSSGADVCLVSLHYAQHNGLQIGDQLRMELYHPAVDSFQSAAIDEAGNFVAGETGDRTFLEMNPCYPDNALGLTKTYTIVGVYTAPTDARGTFAFGEDVIFAPKQSVPKAEAFEMEGENIPLLTSLMIENGTSAEFEAYLEEQGWEGSCLYFDQGYS